MMLPDNGKVVIIDDKIDEVINLISGLSAEKIPFVYYKDESGDDLPETPLQNVRIIFLDLLLIDDNAPPVKKVVSSIISRLKRVLSKDNGPYILIYWSTKRRKYSSALERELSKNSLKEYKPFEILSLSKPSTIEKVQEELAIRFEKFKSLKAFFLFESIANRTAGNIVNQFSYIFSVDGSWDKNLKDVLYKMGEARVGEANFKALSDSEKIKNSLLTISTTIDENIEKSISACDFDEINFDTLHKYDTTIEAKAKFNSRLHLFEPIAGPIKSGNIYFLRNRKAISNEIIDKAKEPHADFQYFRSKVFFLDLTPVCDYSQDKKYVRGVYGILVEKDDLKLFKKSLPAFCKKSPILFIEKRLTIMILDFRFSESMLSKEFKKKDWNASHKISNELLNEFQAELSKYINRPGFTSMY